MNRKRVPIRWRVGVAASTFLLLGACSVKQQPDSAGVACTPECDAGMEEADLVPTNIDAGAAEQDVIEERADAGQVVICPGSCRPDVAAECSAHVEPTEVASTQTLAVAPSPPATDGGTEGALAEADSADAPGALSPDAGAWAAASEALPDASASADAAVGEGSSEAPPESQEYADASKPIVPVDAVELADAGEPLEMHDAGPTQYSCQMTHSEEGMFAGCAPAGNGGSGETCSSGRDCAAGFACVEGRTGTGQCQPYCCDGRTSCEANQICVERRLLADGMPADLEYMVPVCSSPEQCDLSDPFPCPAGEHCACPPGKACTVVGRDGAKDCAVPGTGIEGDACPCAPGYFCSPQREQCMQLCQFGRETCGTGKCQGVGGFPDGVGLCVDVESAEGEL